MKIDTKIITTKGREHQITSSHPFVVGWFAVPEFTMTDIILEQINVERLYDPVLANKEDLVILDIGANIGLFSLYAQDSASKIIAVEPTPDTYNVLQRLIKGVKNIDSVPYALSDKDGTIEFFIHDNPTINSIAVNQAGETVTVQTRTIASIIAEQNLDWVDFVKCDIEGSEMQALTKETLEPVSDKIGSWFIEVHQTNRDQSPWPGNLEQNRQALSEVFKSVGYNTMPVVHDQLFVWK